jgi:hypothetical protein
MAADQWYYLDPNKQPVGPMSAKDLCDLARAKRIHPTTLVTKSGSPKWFEAGRVDGLFTPAVSAATAPPSPLLAVPSIPKVPASDPFLDLSSGSVPALGALDAHAAVMPGKPVRISMPLVIGGVAVGVLAAAVGIFAMVHSGGDGRGASGGPAPVLQTIVPAPAISSATPATTAKEESKEGDVAAEKERLTREVEDLRREKESLQRDLHNLGARLEQLKKWRDVRFVLLNPTRTAVGIQENDKRRFRVVTKAQGDDARAAIAVAAKNSIPRIADEPSLTRRIYQEVEVNGDLTDQMASEVRKYWKIHRYAPFKPDETPTFVAYNDLTTSRERLGFYVGSSAEGLELQPLGPSIEKVQRANIQPGTARKASGEAILSVLSDVDFVDYCILNIAQRVGNKDEQERHVDIAVSVKLDVRREALQFSRTTDNSWDDDYLEYLHRLTGRVIPPDSRKQPIRVLREAGKALEDELYAKLVKVGLPVVEREEIGAVLSERRLAKEGGSIKKDRFDEDEGEKVEAASGDFEPHEYGKLVCATHVVNAEIRPPTQENGDYGLSIRLLDVDSGRVLWAGTGDRDKLRPKVTTQYLLQSGKLAVVTLAKEAAPVEFQGVEQPMVMEPWKSASKTPNREFIVHVEGIDDPKTFEYRTLFGKLTRRAPRTSIEKIDYIRDARDVKRYLPDQLRCSVWRVAKALLPPAGLIQRRGDGQMIVSIGRAAGVSQETKFRVFHPTESADSILPVDLAVSQLHDDSCDIVPLVETSLTPVWPSTSTVAPNDIAVMQNVPLKTVAIAAPALTPPHPDVARKWLRKPGQQVAMPAKTRQAAKRIQEKLLDAFRRLGIPVVLIETPKDIPEISPEDLPDIEFNTRGIKVSPVRRRASATKTPPVIDARASHRIDGTITIVTNMTFRVDLNLTEQAQGTVVDHINFEVSEFQLQ